MTPNLSTIKMRRLLMCMVLCFTGCTAAGEKDFQKFQIEAKTSMDPLKLQQWAVSVAEKHEKDYEVPEEDLPSQIRNFHPEAHPSSFVVEGDPPGKKLILISWGSGFGHWGIIAGDKAYNGRWDSHLKLVNWTPGVYFFRE